MSITPTSILTGRRTDGRSVYRFIFRTLPDPLMETLDVADSSQLTAVRNSSVTALQALSMLNNPLVVRQSEHLAARPRRPAVIWNTKSPPPSASCCNATSPNVSELY